MSNIPGITANSVEGWESLSEAAQLALISYSTTTRSMPSTSAAAAADAGGIQAESYFKELLDATQTSDLPHSRVRRYAFEPANRLNSIFAQYEMLASDYGRKNCQLFSESDRNLPGDVIYGVHDQFESQAKLALSISHFLSSFYQIVNPEEDFPLRNAEKAISERQLYAEVISAIGADFRVCFHFFITLFTPLSNQPGLKSLIRKGGWSWHLLRSQQVPQGETLLRSICVPRTRQS